jgi:hypothetical protein
LIYLSLLLYIALSPSRAAAASLQLFFWRLESCGVEGVGGGDLKIRR